MNTTDATRKEWVEYRRAWRGAQGVLSIDTSCVRSVYKSSMDEVTVDRSTIMRIAVQAQLDPRTVKRALEDGIDRLQSGHSKTRLRAALKKLKFEHLIK